MNLRQLRWLSGRVGVYLGLALTSVILFVPIYLIILISIQSAEDAFSYPPDLWPDALTLDNFRLALVDLAPFGTYLRNTIFISTAVVVGDLISCSLVAYGFARFRFPGRDMLFVVLLSTMMVPLVVRAVPLFILFKNIGWINTFFPLIVPAFFGTPFYIFLLRQFYMTIPNDIVDAARLDGESELGIWWRIMMPLSKPALTAVAIFAFQFTWNDFLGPLLFLQKQDMKTVMLGLYGLMGMYVDWNLVMAAVVASSLPMIVLFFVFQRHFVAGISIGTGLKG